MTTAFVIYHATETIGATKFMGYESINLAGEWRLAYLPAKHFDPQTEDSVEFDIEYSRKAEETFGFITPEYRTFTAGLLKRWYAKPIAMAFPGLLLGWSLVGSEGHTSMCENGDPQWVEIEEDCWHGDIYGVILETVIPGACGCGNNAEAVTAIEKILNTQFRNPFVNEDDRRVHLTESTHANGMLGAAMSFVAYTLGAGDFTEHGTSIYNGWLTPKGIMLALLIQAAKEFESTAVDEAV